MDRSCLESSVSHSFGSSLTVLKMRFSAGVMVVWSYVMAGLASSAATSVMPLYRLYFTSSQRSNTPVLGLM